MWRATISVVAATLVLDASVASAATITKKDGSVVEGVVLGTVLLADAGRPMFAVVEGKDIESVDERGVRLKAGAVVVHTGMPLGTDSATFKSATVGVVLAATMPLAAKHGAVKEVPNAFGLVLNGEGEGPGFGTVAVGKGRAYFMKRFSVSETLPVFGELRAINGSYSTSPVLRLETPAGVVSLEAGSIKSSK